MNFTINKINRLETPEFFKNAYGSTPGIYYEDQYWFIIHKKMHMYGQDGKIFYNYTHSFVIFDKNFKLKKSVFLPKWACFWPRALKIGL